MLTLKELGAKREEAVLSNGTRLVVFERPGMPVYLRASFQAGSRLDDPGKEGTAHFLEHMLVAGTKKFPSKDKLAAYIEQYGGVFGATTGVDSLNVNIGIGDPNDIDKAFEILCEMLSASLFDAKTFETERGSILGEWRDMKSNPGRSIWESVDNLVFQGTPMARSTLGTEKSIALITKEDVINFFNKYIKSDRAILVVSGGVSLNEAVKLAEASFLISKQNKAATDEKLLIVREKLTEIQTYPGTPQVHLALCFRTPGIFHPDMAALDVLGEVLGGGRASVLSRKLRYESGLVYSVGVAQDRYADASLWAVRTSTAKAKLQKVLDVTVAEIKRVIENGLSPEEVKFAQDKIIKSQRMDLQTSSSWAGFHSYRQRISAKPWTILDYLDDISKVTPGDTRRVAGQYLGLDKWYLALCGDISPDIDFSVEKAYN